jgi:hypothetical protein
MQRVAARVARSPRLAGFSMASHSPRAMASASMATLSLDTVKQQRSTEKVVIYTKVRAAGMMGAGMGAGPAHD